MTSVMTFFSEHTIRIIKLSTALHIYEGRTYCKYITIKVAKYLWLKCNPLRVWTLLNKWWCVRQQNTCIAACIVSSAYFLRKRAVFATRSYETEYSNSSAFTLLWTFQAKLKEPVTTRKMLNVFAERYNEIHGCAHTLIFKRTWDCWLHEILLVAAYAVHKAHGLQ